MAAVSRKTRNYKEKKSMLTFGHLVLPLAALVAVGLLFVGIKLFFLTPAEKKIDAETNITTTIDATDKAIKTVSADSFSTAVTGVKSKDKAEVPKAEQYVKKSKTQLAGPVAPDTTKAKTGSKAEPVSTVKKVKKTETAVPKESVKEGTKPPVLTKKPAEQKTAKSETARGEIKAAPAGTKWAVQIGSFVNEQSASVLAEQAKKQGYSVAVSKGEVGGNVYHRVRVVAGPNKEAAAKLASELEGKGYPVSVVPSH